MRIENMAVPGQGGLKVKPGASSFTDSLNEGDIVRAEVLSSHRGSVILKSDTGQVFKAKLAADLHLLQGEKVVMEVESPGAAGRENGIVSLAVRGENATAGTGPAVGETGGKPWPGVDLEDKSLEPYAFKLSELRFPVTEEAARQMRGLILQYPGMTLDEAAFIVSNKLTGDAGLVKAAIAFLSDGEKTDDLIMKLLALLDQPNIPPEPGSGKEGQAALYPQSTTGAQLLPGNLPSLSGAEAATPGAVFDSLAGFLRLVVQSAADVTGIISRGEQGGFEAAKPIIPQGDSIMQSTNVENVEEISSKSVKITEQIDTNRQNSPISEPMPPLYPESGSLKASFNPDGFGIPQGIGNADPGSAKFAVDQITENAEQAQPTFGAAFGQHQNENTTLSAGEQLPQPNASQAPGDLQNAAASLTRILSGIREFHGTPAPLLEKFANMLLRIAGDGTDISKAEAGKLRDLADKLFTKIEKGDRDAGERLRSAKDELYARIAQIEEAISRSSHPARADMLQQTGRLTEHVRLLNNLEQYAYIQLPVMFGEEHKSAELYVFKKKGSKKPDPENVNILLALDLENMGRWESLLSFRRKDVSINMEVSGEAEKVFFSNNTVMLHDLLAEAGFKLINVGITCTGEETTPLTALAALDRFAGARSGGIDYMI